MKDMLIGMEMSYRNRYSDLCQRYDFWDMRQFLRPLVEDMRELRQKLGMSTDGLWLHEIKNG